MVKCCMHGPNLRILAWNILHGGGPRRIPEIALALVSHRPDIVVLTEFRSRRGGQLRAVLADHGLGYHARTPESNSNGILLASRLALEPQPVPADYPGAPGRWLEALAPSLRLRVGAVHVPDDTLQGEKAAFWQFLVRLAGLRREERCVVIGDFNTARLGQDTDGPASGCGPLVGKFTSLGFRDAWRHRHPTGREPTWISFEGAGCRIDTAYVSPPLLPLVREAAYSHAQREAGASDHSLLTLDLGPFEPTPAAPASGLYSH